MKKILVFLVIAAFIGVMAGMVYSGSADPKIAVINKGVNNKSTIDYLNEDDLTSDSDGAVASQQSIKAYVDAQVINRASIVVSTFATGVTTYTVTAADGNVWLIDASLVTSSTSTDANGFGANIGLYTDANVHVLLPTTITEDMDGQPMTFYKSDSGTTNIVFWAGGTATSGVSIDTTSGVTLSGYDLDAEGDQVTLIADYTNQIYRLWTTPHIH